MFESHRHATDGMVGDALTALTKSGPPVAVSALSLGGVGLQDWVLILTGFYLVIQIGYLLWKWLRELQAKRSAGDV